MRLNKYVPNVDEELANENMESLAAALGAESEDDFLKAIFGADDDDDDSSEASSDESATPTEAVVENASFEPLDEATLNSIIQQTQTLSSELSAELEAGRDRLLELHSNRPERIQEHLDALARADRDVTLPNFMSAVFDRFGVDVEEQGHWWIVRPAGSTA